MTSDVFVDTGVLFAACHSTAGSARDLVLRAVDGGVGLVVSTYVLTELRRSLIGNSVPRLATPDVIFGSDTLAVVDPDPATVTTVAEIVTIKVAPVIAAAMAAKARLVATYERRHLLSQAAEIRAAFGVEALTPEEILRRLRTVRRD